MSRQQLCDESLLHFGCHPSDVFIGETLYVDEARQIGSILQTPGIDRARVVACSFQTVLPRVFDTLLGPVEESSAGLLFASSSPIPETFRSRFQVLEALAPDLQSLYEQFGEVGREVSVDDVVARVSAIPEDDVRHLYDLFVQSSGTVGEFVEFVHDGNREGALRVSLGFRAPDIELLYAELEQQLQGKSFVGTPLTRIDHERILKASSVREAATALSPSAQVALLFHYLL